MLWKNVSYRAPDCDQMVVFLWLCFWDSASKFYIYLCMCGLQICQRFFFPHVTKRGERESASVAYGRNHTEKYHWRYKHPRNAIWVHVGKNTWERLMVLFVAVTLEPSVREGWTFQGVSFIPFHLGLHRSHLKKAGKHLREHSTGAAGVGGS